MTELDAAMVARGEDARKAAEEERALNKPQAETSEEFYARVAAVPGIFGDRNIRPTPPTAPPTEDELADGVVVEQIIPVDVPSVEIQEEPPAPEPEPEPVVEEPKDEAPAKEPEAPPKRGPKKKP